MKVLAAIAFLALTSANIHEQAYYKEKFNNWLAEHNVVADSDSHFEHMLRNFAHNDDLIKTHNADESQTYKLGHNKFSHMNEAEWHSFVHTNLKKSNLREESADVVHETDVVPVPIVPPVSVDWVSYGAVTTVKDQGNCQGGGWAFSVTGAIECAYFLRMKNHGDFSEQALLSCDTRESACSGGSMIRAFNWVKNNGGLPTETSYPYTSGVTGAAAPCLVKPVTSNTNLLGYTAVLTGNSAALVVALVAQPVAVAINVNPASFQLYASGVYSDTACSSTTVNHGALAVGYGTDSVTGVSYWTIKNSWGTSWGDHGYMKLNRDINNLCGILNTPSYPTIRN